MEFDKIKKTVLNKKDKSSKGNIDEKIKSLCDKINLDKNYFTTSSCSGRICLLKLGRNKKESDWLIVTHNLAKSSDFKNTLDKYNGKNKVVFKMEPPILHVCCRTLEDAQLLLDQANMCGFNKSGIISFKNKIVVELAMAERLETYVYDKQKLVDDEYVSYLIKTANKKLIKCWTAIKNLERIF